MESSAAHSTRTTPTTKTIWNLPGYGICKTKELFFNCIAPWSVAHSKNWLYSISQIASLWNEGFRCGRIEIGNMDLQYFICKQNLNRYDFFSFTQITLSPCTYHCKNPFPRPHVEFLILNQLFFCLNEQGILKSSQWQSKHDKPYISAFLKNDIR